MTRTEIAAGVAQYRVRRPAWGEIGWTVAVRLSLAILGALAGTIAIGQGWI